MLTPWAPTRVFLARDAVDGRKGIDGLCQVVRDVFGDDPHDGSAFLFFNRRRNRLRALVWDHNGFWLHLKRVERGTFGRRCGARRGGRHRARDVAHRDRAQEREISQTLSTRSAYTGSCTR